MNHEYLFPLLVSRVQTRELLLTILAAYCHQLITTQNTQINKVITHAQANYLR